MATNCQWRRQEKRQPLGLVVSTLHKANKRNKHPSKGKPWFYDEEMAETVAEEMDEVKAAREE